MSRSVATITSKKLDIKTKIFRKIIEQTFENLELISTHYFIYIRYEMSFSFPSVSSTLPSALS